MASAFADEELTLSISLPAYEGSKPRPSLPTIMSPPARQPIATPLPESPGTARAMNRLHQYAFIRNLGEGSFGKVKLARHKITGQEVAMKTISRRKLINRDMAGRIEREIQYLQLLRHPHIIKLYTVITTKTDIYMVLEYVPMELFDYIVKHGRLAEAKARKLFQQIICAVEYCHRHKIVHRDLKPENLLLDQNMNVKIADFGLSNIMTDGNFLKTSCGSPNYAAPEVIGGKLYAGPEVDVWSCGVILYVFLVGRLPFDDEFIPSLFRKIQAGSFHIPSTLPRGAVNLIKKCLQTDPTKRISIAEIREDEWFKKDLPAYLVEPVDEFLDTGVDPLKAIDPRSLAPGKTVEEAVAVHDEVVDKLGRTMGYARDDVKDALGKDEPSAIKDAYLIVRENKLMMATQTAGFMAASPPIGPAFETFTPPASHTPKAVGEMKPLTPSRGDVHRTSRTLSDTPAFKDEERPRVSNVRVLNTSLPSVHQSLLEARHAAKAKGQDPDSILHPDQIEEKGQIDVPEPIPEEVVDEKSQQPLVRPKAEQEATSRALKPHSRSTVAMNKMREGKGQRPEGMTTISKDKDKERDREKAAQPKPKRGKWQFGIRSRNQPFEAMKCLFNSLKMSNAEWEIDPLLMSEDGNEEGRDDLPPPPSQLANGERHKILQGKFPHIRSDYYVPRDPWLIRARVLKKGLYPAGVDGVPASAHNSTASLPSEAAHHLKQRIEEMGGYAAEDLARTLGMNGVAKAMNSQPTSAHNTRPNSAVGDGPAPLTAPEGHDAHAGSTTTNRAPTNLLPLITSGSKGSIKEKHLTPSDEIGIWVFIDIQLYMLDQTTFMCDFKCDGYQNVQWFDPKIHDWKNGKAVKRKGHGEGGSPAASPVSSRPTSGFSNGPTGGLVKTNSGASIRSMSGRRSEEAYWRPTTKRYRNKEKDITSPYPYLDVASDLVAQLAAH